VAPETVGVASHVKSVASFTSGVPVDRAALGDEGATDENVAAPTGWNVAAPTGGCSVEHPDVAAATVRATAPRHARARIMIRT
jgi:hypothetical protein